MLQPHSESKAWYPHGLPSMSPAESRWYGVLFFDLEELITGPTRCAAATFLESREIVLPQTFKIVLHSMTTTLAHRSRTLVVLLFGAADNVF